MIFQIVWSFVWFAGCTLLAIFFNRFNEWTEKKRKGRSYYKTAQTSWTIKQAFRIYNLMMVTGRTLWAFFAFNSALNLYKSVALAVDHTPPEILRTVFNFYAQHIWLVLMFLFAGIIIYTMFKGMTNDWFLLPVWVINNTDRSLKIYIRNWFIGETSPGGKIQNNYLQPLHKNYLIEAKDAQGNVLFAKDFSRRELEEIDGKVEVSF
jgi:hypothetical protein